MRGPHLSSRGAVSGSTAPQQRNSLLDVASLDFGPSAIDRALCSPEGKALLCCHCDQLLYTPPSAAFSPRSEYTRIARPKLTAKDGG